MGSTSTTAAAIGFDRERIKNDTLLFEHLIEGIRDYAIFMIDLEGTIVTWNRGVKRLLGYEESDFVGKPFSIIFSAEDAQVNIPESELKTAHTTGRAEDERWHKRSDGSLFWANGLVTVMKEGDKPIGFTKIMRDQTEKKRFEDQLAEQANALAIANKGLSNFAGVVSHDLNAPLQTVYGFANILREQSGLNPEVEQSVHHIVAGTEQMIRLVNDLLQYTLTAPGDDDLTFVDVFKVLEQVLVGLTGIIQKRNATVHLDTLPAVWADATQLGRVFQNLIENGIKYCPADRNPEIEIRAEDTGSETAFTVRDNGLGIDDSHLSRLFVLFERIHTDSNIPGQGIGLATCKKIIERFGGKMWVTSKLNEGSSFYFTIPHVVQSAPEGIGR